MSADGIDHPSWSTDMKKCCRCKIAKPFTAYSKHRNEEDGHQPNCKKCARQYRTDNASRIKSQVKVWRMANAERVKKQHKDYCSQRKHLGRVKGIVYYALMVGKITLPISCESCGKECRPEAHHEDYDKPLDVKWLCRSCHAVTWRKVFA